MRISEVWNINMVQNTVKAALLVPILEWVNLLQKAQL
jgi:hypothetical protein